MVFESYAIPSRLAVRFTIKQERNHFVFQFQNIFIP